MVVDPQQSGGEPSPSLDAISSVSGSVTPQKEGCLFLFLFAYLSLMNNNIYPPLNERCQQSR